MSGNVQYDAFLFCCVCKNIRIVRSRSADTETMQLKDCLDTLGIISGGQKGQRRRWGKRKREEKKTLKHKKNLVFRLANGRRGQGRVSKRKRFH